jgi:hypothetical protein
VISTKPLRLPGGTCGIIACVLALGGCDQLSSVGTLKEPAPRAIATSIGEQFQADDNGDMTLTVRAGAEVVISGKESRKGDDDQGVPLIAFDWQQDAGDVPQVQLIRRTVNTSSFTAPQVTADDTELHFTLTVSDAKGATDTARATVRVRNFRDADRFLQYLGADTTLPVTVATATPIAGDSAATATEEHSITVTMTKLVTFRDRNGVLQVARKVGAPVALHTGWARRLGSSDKCLVSQDVAANSNPTVRFSLPVLNLDDTLQESIPGFAGAAVLSDVMEASDLVDPETKLQLQFDVTSTAGTPMLCIGQGSAVAQASGTVKDAEALAQSVQPRDSPQSAEAYYKAINPATEVQKTTLVTWLQQNGFDEKASNWNADAHAVYTNDYDLGFGRDMYMKFGNCDAGVDAGTPLQDRRGKCDVAAVVMNYPSVEASAKRLNAFAAVAMEYSRLRKTDTSGERFVKFYTFTPDTRTGEYRRALSLNFDRRGEQYMPQACTTCHGGTPGTLVGGVYPANGNVAAGFLPWDLDSFLFTSTDPGFSTRSRDATLKDTYSRNMQQAQFKLLNRGAYLTYADPAGIPGRFALARELVEGWYGGAGLPDATFNGAFVPDGWKSANNGNPPDSDAVYQDVFARNCRMCHTMHVPGNGDPLTATITVPVLTGTSSPTITLPACTNDDRLDGTSTGAASQVPMGCYSQFVHAPNLAERLAGNQMPLARRTSDRMWVSTSGTSAGAYLQAHLLGARNVTVPSPGTAATAINTSPSGADFGEWLTLDGTASKFAGDVTWSVNACTGTPVAPGNCSRALPVVGRNDLRARLRIDDVATYQVNLVAPGTTSTEYVQVADKALVLEDKAMSFQIGGQGVLPLVVKTRGNGALADHTMLLTPGPNLVVAPLACTVSPGCPASTTVNVGATTSTAINRSIGISVIDAGSNAVPMTATVAVAVQSTFTAQPLAIATSIMANAASPTVVDVLALARNAVGRSDVTITSFGYTGARSPAWSFNGTSLSYQPSAGFATHDKNGADGGGTKETFTYQLRRPDTGEVSSSTITVPVRARVSFQDARSTWPSSTASNGSCSSNCHAPSSAYPAAPKFAGFTYDQFITGALSTNAAKKYVKAGSVDDSESGLLCYPQQLSACGSGHDVLVDSTALDSVRKWIADGANNF